PAAGDAAEGRREPRDDSLFDERYSGGPRPRSGQRAAAGVAGEHVPGRNAGAHSRARSQRCWRGDLIMSQVMHQAMRIKVAAVLLVSLSAASASYAQDREVEQKVQASPQGSVRISNVAGMVNVTGWDRSEVQVKARLNGNVERVDVSSED